MASLWLYIMPVFQFLALCVASYGFYMVCRWALYRMPHRFKMRFWLYRNEKVQELVPLLKEAIRLDRAHWFSTGSFRCPYADALAYGDLDTSTLLGQLASEGV